MQWCCPPPMFASTVPSPNGLCLLILLWTPTWWLWQTAAPSLRPSCGHKGFSVFALPLCHRLPRGLKHPPPLSAAVFSCRHQTPFQPLLLFDAHACSFSARFVIPQTSPAIPSLCCFPLYVSRHDLILSWCLVSRHYQLLLHVGNPVSSHTVFFHCLLLAQHLGVQRGCSAHKISPLLCSKFYLFQHSFVTLEQISIAISFHPPVLFWICESGSAVGKKKKNSPR